MTDKTHPPALIAESAADAIGTLVPGLVGRGAAALGRRRAKGWDA